MTLYIKCKEVREPVVFVYVDGRPGEQWPPTYHGTGSEEVFGGGACPNQAYSGPYTGFHMVENPDFGGKNAMYRWYVHDPIRFERSLAWTIEHGHANNYGNDYDYSSVAYWYQIEPHAPVPALPDALARLPRFPNVVFEADAARVRCRERIDQMRTASADERLWSAQGRRGGRAAGRCWRAVRRMPLPRSSLLSHRDKILDEWQEP